MTSDDTSTSTPGASSQSPGQINIVFEDDLPSRPIRRRAAMACAACRNRKLRCNMLEERPCSNCRFAGIECLQQESRRGAKGSLANTPESEDSNLTGNSSVLRSSHGTANSMPSASQQFTGRTRDPITGHRIIQPAPSNDVQNQQPQEQIAPPADFDLDAQLPPFVHPPPSTMSLEDVYYLCIKEAFTLPPASLQQALIQAYIQHVHPMLPLLDVYPLLGTVSNLNNQRTRVSLLLYQAVMFSGAAFVNEESLLNCGYQSRRGARDVFFGKTRLLYDFDYEQSRLVMLQALLLMSQQCGAPDDDKGPWHWSGIAISVAYTLGLHRDPGSHEGLRKRIWWCCVMRDSLLALDLRQPARISKEDFDVLPLEDANFEIYIQPEHVAWILSERVLPHAPHNAALQKNLSSVCMAMAELCVHINRITRSGPEDDGLASAGRDLVAWADSLPPCWCYPPLLADVSYAMPPAAAVHRALLHMVYQTTMSTLHRTLLLRLQSIHPAEEQAQQARRSHQYIREVATNVARLASELNNLGLARLLPNTAVTALLPAMITNLVEMRNLEVEARERAASGFEECLSVTKELRDIYPAAEHALTYLGEAIHAPGGKIESEQQGTEFLSGHE